MSKKKVLTLVLALVLMFALSVSAFAGNPGTVSVTVCTKDYSTGALTTIDTFAPTVGTNTSVADVVTGKYGNAAVWDGSYLEGLTVNSVSYPSLRYPATHFDSTTGIYIGGDDLINDLNSKSEFIAYGGIWKSMEIAMDDEDYAGYFIMGDRQHMCTITCDWMYEVNYAGDDPDEGYVYPGAVMPNCILSDGDQVRLTYGLVWWIF